MDIATYVQRTHEYKESELDEGVINKYQDENFIPNNFTLLDK